VLRFTSGDLNAWKKIIYSSAAAQGGNDQFDTAKESSGIYLWIGDCLDQRKVIHEISPLHTC
jgi:hypothetical protein